MLIYARETSRVGLSVGRIRTEAEGPLEIPPRAALTPSREVIYGDNCHLIGPRKWVRFLMH